MRVVCLILILCVLWLSAPRATPLHAEETNWFSQKAIPGHSIQFLSTGQEMTQARRDLISQAQHTIYLATYIFLFDDYGLEFVDRLCQKSQEGVDVRVLLDAYGSRKIKYKLDRFRECGIRVQFFTPSHWGVGTLFYTMHEKLLIIDGKSVQLGGNNFEYKYGEGHRASSLWYDLDVKVDGPSACWYHQEFINKWKYASALNQQVIETEREYELKSRPSEIPFLPYKIPAKEAQQLFGLDSLTACTPTPAGSANVYPILGNPVISDERPILSAHLQAIRSSQKSIKLYAPYFIPHKDFVRELVAARARGVDITIISNSPKSNDESAKITVGMFMSIKKLFQSGVKLQLWDQKGTMHRKGGVFDDQWAFFGSDNLDRRGQNYSTESVIYTDNPASIQQMTTEFELDLQITTSATEHFAETYLNSKSFIVKWITQILLNYM